MTKSDDALVSFKNGFTCSSAVFSAFSDELGLDNGTAKKIACGFGAGNTGRGRPGYYSTTGVAEVQARVR